METTTVLEGYSDQEKGAYLGAMASIATADRQAKRRKRFRQYGRFNGKNTGQSFLKPHHIFFTFKTSSMLLRTIKGTMLLLIFSAGLTFSSCKGKEKDKDVNTTTNPDTLSTPNTTETTIPETTVTDAQLKDATKDFPGVTATVNNGEVTLTGNIKRDDLPRLMQSVQALNPKKVNNNLTIK